ncbi:hypothetical protein KDN24_06810 [Bacillus sp. Bva_UNVM-123]|uniref:hypothetical protein n=1 Tax=Bacillus sp. Bva_UNVM-123 TaxID=2829798 RepID=UPI00391F5062
MSKSHLRGHQIEYLNEEWVYSDTKEPTMKTHQERTCGHCNEANTREGHDACLGTLKGVMNACCGHGDINLAYIQLLDGYCVRGSNAITIMEILKKTS